MTLKHFNLEEDPKMAGLDNALMMQLDNARDMAGVPFVITSGLRTPEESITCGGYATDPHTKGLGADIASENDQTNLRIIYGALVAGFCRIFIGKGHIHLDIDKDEPQNVLGVEKNYFS